MRRLATSLALILVAATTASAQELSANSRTFLDVCVANAPGFSEAAIAAAARVEVPRNTSGFAQASVAVDEGQGCVLALSGVTTVPTDAEVQALASSFARRVGAGTIQQVRSAIGGDAWYRVDVGGAVFGVEAIPEGSRVRYSISRR